MAKEPNFISQSAPVDLPEMVEAAYYKTLKTAGRAFWRGMTMVAASGFGKAVLLTLGIAAVGLALTSAAAGTGFFAGAAIALELLLTTVKGWGVLAVFGTLGAINEMKKEQSRVQAQVAKVQEQDYELSRQLQQVQQLQPQRETKAPAPEIPECNHCAQELERRAANPVETAKTL